MNQRNEMLCSRSKVLGDCLSRVIVGRVVLYNGFKRDYHNNNHHQYSIVWLGIVYIDYDEMG